MEIIIENLWYDLLLTIISAVLGAVLGVIIPKIIKNNKNDSTIRVDKQLVFAQIHIEQNHYIYNKSEVPKTVSYNSSNGQGMSGGELLVAYVIGSLFLIYGFLRFESQISKVILIMTVLLESTFLTTSYVITKKYYIDKSIRSILIFNIFATLCSPILLYLMKNPLANIFVNKEMILDRIKSDGIFSVLSDLNVYGFILYQAIGIIILFGFMIFTMIGTVHILSMVNLALENKLIKLWRWLYKKTLGFCKSVGFYIGFGILLLVICFLLVSGILTSFLK